MYLWEEFGYPLVSMSNEMRCVDNPQAKTWLKSHLTWPFGLSHAFSIIERSASWEINALGPKKELCTG